jgi:hypothetical protein
LLEDEHCQLLQGRRWILWRMISIYTVLVVVMGRRNERSSRMVSGDAILIIVGHGDGSDVDSSVEMQ